MGTACADDMYISRSPKYQHQGHKRKTERRGILKQRQPTCRLKQRLSAFRDDGGKTVSE